MCVLTLQSKCSVKGTVSGGSSIFFKPDKLEHQVVKLELIVHHKRLVQAKEKYNNAWTSGNS